MLDWLIRRRIAAFEKQFDYDMSYARELLGFSRAGFMRFSRLYPMANYRDGVPPNAWHAAKIVAARAEDCGPCTQLVVDMARAAGVDDPLLRAVLREDLQAVGPEVALAIRYTRAAIAHSPEIAALRDEVIGRWGEKGLASLALTITATRMFPMLKYALGHGQACQRVQVGSEAVNTAALPAAHAA